MDPTMVPRHPGKVIPRGARAQARRPAVKVGPRKPGPNVAALPQAMDTPARLLREIQEGRQDPKTLTGNQRKACLVLLANGRQTSAELAEVFGVSPSRIREEVREIRSEVGRQVREWGLDEVVGDLAMTAEKVCAMAYRNEDLALVWSVKRDLARTLKELGVVGPRDEGSTLRVTIEQLPRAYDRARGILLGRLDPALTGEVVEVEAEVKAAPALPGPRRVPVEVRGQDVEVQVLEPREGPPGAGAS